MPLQASGQISLGNIADELGSNKLNLSLSDSINTAELNATNPDQMSDFYSYANSEDYLAQSAVSHGVRYDASSAAGAFMTAPTQDFSISIWLKPVQSTGTNGYFAEFRQASGVSTSRILFYYRAVTDEIWARLQTVNGQFQNNFLLSHASNTGITGITNAATGWCTSQVGNVNSEGFAHIVMVYNGSGGGTTPTNVISVYWNGSALTSTNSVNTTRATFASGLLFGASGNAVPLAQTGQVFSHDMFSVFTDVLTPAEVGTLYNNGIPVSDAQHGLNNILLESRIEGVSPVVDASQASDWSVTSWSGTITAY